MTEHTILLLITAFAVKHFLIDFVLQTPYQWKNKGTYGHPGGLLHAGLHGIGTAFCLLQFDWQHIAFLSLLDAVFYYHIDWAKMRLNSHYGWQAESSEYFWWTLGADQLLHTLTYIIIIALIH